MEFDLKYLWNEATYFDQGSEGEVQMQAFSDEQMADMWLNQLTTSPAGFLRTKFAIQAAQSAPGPASERDR